jgi:hypothetical protein
MKLIRAWWAKWFSKRDARICLRCSNWRQLDPGIEPVGRCRLDDRCRYAHESCLTFAKEEV